MLPFVDSALKFSLHRDEILQFISFFMYKKRNEFDNKTRRKCIHLLVVQNDMGDS